MTLTKPTRAYKYTQEKAASVYHRVMSETLLPKSLDYRSAASRGSRFHTRLSSTELPRVDALLDTPGQIVADLGFHEDDQRWAHVTGHVEYTIELACDRCLEAVVYSGQVDVDGVIVSDDDQAANVPRRFEPTIVNGVELDTFEFIADEILLSLPQALHCARPNCIAQFQSGSDEYNRDKSRDVWRPFANLKH